MKTLKTSFIIVVILLMTITSCENLKDTYHEFVKDGETVYVAKADSIKVRGGKNRIEISWLLLTDPNVSQYKIFWNNKKEFEEGFIQKTSQVDTVRVMFNDMEEDTYEFDIILYDRYGNSSITASTIGQVYGERYQRSLLNRVYRNVYRLNSRDIEVEWMPATEGMLDVHMEYMDRMNVNRSLVMPDSITIATITDFPIDGTLQFRTAFIPEIAALDTFYSNYQNISDPFFEVECDKSLWSNAMIPGDSWTGEYSWVFANMWDNKFDAAIGTDGYDWFRQMGAPPIWFTIDLGAKYRLTGVKLNHDTYNPTNFWRMTPKTFEIWVANEKSEDWDDWTLAGEFESIKPSGSPVGTNTALDLEVLWAGETFRFAPMTYESRYVRFKTLTNFVSGTTAVHIKELTFWGQPVEED